jgi:hypothetical protein
MNRALGALITIVAACSGEPAPSHLARSADDLFGERLVPRFELELDDAARASLAARPKEWVRARFRAIARARGGTASRRERSASTSSSPSAGSWE